MELSGKQQTFFEFFFSFLKCGFNLEHFLKKLTLITDVFRKLRTPKNMVRSMTKKSRFRVSVEKQDRRCQENLFKFEERPLYHINYHWAVNCPTKSLS